MNALPEEAFAAALAALDRMTAPRLAVLLDHAQPSAIYDVISGQRPATGLVAQVLATEGLASAWRAGLAKRPPEALWEQCQQAGIDVLVRGRAGYPPALMADPAPAPVLFVRGSFDRLAGRRAGIVGTRNASGAGRDIAATLGRDLAAAGVHVVSGLARGIDGCAHRGALSVEAAVPVGVVATGLDVVYPREHRALWHEVAARGVLVSEAAPGTTAEPWRFPLRNRILAALSEVVVVVESRQAGGSLITAAEAERRRIQVMVVPGSPRNAAAAGTNNLAREGRPIATCADDVLVALHLDTARQGPVVYDPRPRPDPVDGETLALCAEPRTLDQVMLASGRTLVECAMSLARLEAAGWLQQVNGWFEQAPAITRAL